MRVGIFDPYLDTLGGGEKYILTIASCLSKKHEVFIFWNPAFESMMKKEAKKKLGIDLSAVKFAQNIFGKNTFPLSRLLATKKYDSILFISDGSIPLLLSKKNIIIFQFPVNWVNGKSLLSKFKLRRVQRVICYSEFVKRFIDKTFGINSVVLYPPTTHIKSPRLKKENIILTVGRFTKAVNAKKQEMLIQTFKKMCDEGLLGWRFILIGSVMPSDEDFVNKLRMEIKRYPILVLDNVTFYEMRKYYQKAKIYWHAAGFGEDLKNHPERAEHFGIATVEAMERGAVPVVINAGGQKEIVEDGKNGFLWATVGELIADTIKLVNNDRILKKMSLEAVKRSRTFTEDKFCKELDKLIQ